MLLCCENNDNDDADGDEYATHCSAGYVQVASTAVLRAVTPMPICSNGKVQRSDPADEPTAQNVED